MILFSEQNLFASNFPGAACPIPIIRRAALADAFTDGRAVAELEPDGKAASEITRSWKWLTRQGK